VDSSEIQREELNGLPSRRRATTVRWVSILALAAIGSGVFLGAVPYWGGLVSWVRIPAELHPWFVFSVAIAVDVGVFMVIAQLLRFRSSHLRLALRYPPLWFAPALALTLAIGLWLSPVAPFKYPRFITSSDLATAAVAVLLGLALGRPRVDVSEGVGTERTPQSPALADWILKEAPLREAAGDLFGRKPLVDRIVRHLSKPWGDEQSVALVGPFGSGKSSVISLVEQRLHAVASPRTVICRVSCWGLESSAAAPLHALNRAVETLDTHVDCRAIQGLPAAYERLITAEPTGILARLLDRTGGDREWQQQLRQLSPILRAVDLRLVIVVEDAERTGKDYDPQHIQRLLWSLREVAGVTFVVAVDSEASGIDVSKVCDHVERVPSVDPDHVRGIVRFLRDLCRKSDVIDPVEDHERADALDVGEAESPLAAYARGLHRDSVAQSMSSLLTTPRQLKHFARRVVRAWECLRGEIDPDDLIVASALREGATECFEFLSRNRSTVRRRDPDWPEKPAQHDTTIYKAWEMVRGRSSDPAAVQKLVDYLALRALCPPNASVRPQGIQNKEPADYFRRLLDEVVPDSEIRDQTVLAAIDAYRKREPNSLVSDLLTATDYERRYAAVWEHFSERTGNDDLRRFTEEVLEGLKRRDGARSSGKHPALLALWRQAGKRLRSPEMEDWVSGMVTNALSVSIGLANELYYFWGSVKYGPVSDGPQRNAVRIRLVEAAQRVYTDPAQLRVAFDAARPYEIRHLMLPVDQDEAASVLTAPTDWRWLAKSLLTLLAGGTDGIAAALCHVAGDITATDSLSTEGDVEVLRKETYTLNRERIVAMFETDRDELLRLMSKMGGEVWFVERARVQAIAWLRERAKAAENRA
jgi:hypothetical protein